MQKKLFGKIDISSSQDASKLSATVSGLIIGLSSLIVYGAAFMGYSIVDAQVSAFAVQAGLATGALVTLYGVIRKLMNALSW